MVASIRVSAASTATSIIPRSVVEDYPVFVDFMSAYLEYLETEGKPSYQIRNSQNFLDPDDTLLEFIDRFYEEMRLIPPTVVSDKRLLAKHIYELYASKGTMQSFKFLFRVLFNEDIEVYLPSKDILAPSDGKYQRNRVIRISKLDDQDPFDLIGNTIYQLNDSLTTRIASAVVENVVKVTYGVDSYYDLYINTEKVTGTFSLSRSIYSGGKQFLSKIEAFPDFSGVVNRGAYYSPGDRVRLYSTNNQGFSAEVETVDGSGIDGVMVLDSGKGYSDFTTPYGVNILAADTSTLGTGAKIKLSFDSVGSIQSLTLLDGGQGYVVPPTFTLPITPVGVGARAAVLRAYGNGIGKVSSISVVDLGTPVNEVPICSIDTRAIVLPTYPDQYGNPKVFYDGELVTFQPDRVILESGYAELTEAGDALLLEQQSDITSSIRIAKVQDGFAVLQGQFEMSALIGETNNVILESGGSFLNELSPGNLQNKTIIGQMSGAKTRILKVAPYSVKVSRSPISQYIALFTNSDGMLDDYSKRIQDSKYYQNFSYVIKSGHSLDKYKNVVYSLLHPAGMALFGEISVNSIAQMFSQVISNVENHFTVRINMNLDIQNTWTHMMSIINQSTANYSSSGSWLDEMKFTFDNYDSGTFGTNQTTQYYRIAPGSVYTFMDGTIGDFSSLTFGDFYKYLDSGDVSSPFDAHYSGKYYILNEKTIPFNLGSEISVVPFCATSNSVSTVGDGSVDCLVVN